MASTTPKPSDLASTEGLSTEYDFVIIGGGTAGLVIATRLTEDPKLRVLVVEAGADRTTDPFILTPGLAGAIYDNPAYDWEFKTVPQKNISPPGRQIPHPRGKVLGGSSAIYQNKIVYNSESGFNAWETLGNPGWNWESMKPYLKRFHTYKPQKGPIESEIFDHCRVDEVLNGDNGPIVTSFHGWAPSDTDFYEAVRKISRDNNIDEKYFGGSASPASIDPVTKTRSYVGNTYYNPEVATRPNLRIVTEAVVQRIVLEKGEQVTASGVEFVSKAREKIIAKAGKEVLLTAGAFGSPQILELSGIGSLELLKSHGIEVVVDNPNVGENLQDHGVSSVSFEVADGVPTADVMKRDPSVFPALMEMYQKDRAGPLASHFTVSAFMPTPGPPLFGPSGKKALSEILAQNSNPYAHPNEKEFEALLCDIYSKPDGSSGHFFRASIQFNISDYSTITDYTTPKYPENYFSLFCSGNFLFSRGNVHIISSSASDKPAVDPRYLSHPLDLEIMARHIQWLHTLINTAPFSKHFKKGGATIPRSWPSDKEPTLEKAKEIVKERYLSNFHPTGTCAMLPKEKGGVVDGKLKVYGVKGLRVVDASIFPLSTQGNPITTVYAVAERAVDIIREDWKVEGLVDGVKRL